MERNIIPERAQMDYGQKYKHSYRFNFSERTEQNS